MADETAAVTEALDLAPVDVFGVSDGGDLLLHLALARRELIAATVPMCANYCHRHPEVFDVLDRLAATDSYFAELYGERSPDGLEHWPVVAAKEIRVNKEELTFTPADLVAIQIPTLVLAADDDVLLSATLCHSSRLSQTLQLAMVPNATHGLIFEQPALVASS